MRRPSWQALRIITSDFLYPKREAEGDQMHTEGEDADDNGRGG